MAKKEHVKILRRSVDEWNEWRYKHPEVPASLSGARLSGNDLVGADLVGADLSGADLSSADLSNGNLSSANLQNANLKNANLNSANLSRANMSGANLSNATLVGAHLLDAKLFETILVDVDLNRATVMGVNLSSASLCGAKLIGTDLSRASLRDADLSNAHLIDANLRETDLSGACLDSADLSGAKLENARLSGAKLRAHFNNTDFSGADLSGADLSGADLGSADFTKAQFRSAILSGATLKKARVEGTVFADMDLREVVGLESMSHGGPSEISISTFYRSKGQIPEVFLRGCGVPEEFITYMPSLTARAIEFYSCFISYSQADKPFARRLHDALQGRGIRCWLDEHELLPGDKIYAEVDRGIRLWDKVLLCCSKEALRSWWVDHEIEIALDKERQLWKDRGRETLALIPLNLDGYMFGGEWRGGKATQIASRLAADFTGWKRSSKRFDEQLEKVVKALRSDAGGREAPPISKL
jgi:uncharacterized protein YjbI with pentapeptide repeats